MRSRRRGHALPEGCRAGVRGTDHPERVRERALCGARVSSGRGQVNVVIVGCGRVGGLLAGLLDAEGHHVSVVDIAAISPARAERAWFQHLPSSFKGDTILGDGTDLEILRQAGIEQADAVLALTEGDNRNLMTAQIAKKIFGVKRVIAKVNDPVRAQMYRQMGIDTLSRTSILGTLLFAMLMEDREVGEVLVRKALAHEEEIAHEAGKVRS